MASLAPSRDAEICLGKSLGSFLIGEGPFQNYLAGAQPKEQSSLNSLANLHTHTWCILFAISNIQHHTFLYSHKTYLSTL